jgi:transcriptional regulator with XRE-family HTH domain
MTSPIARLVKGRREEIGFSRQDLARRSEVSYPYFSQIENGDRTPSLETMRKLADALELPVSDLAAAVAPDAWAGSPSGSWPSAVSAPLRAASADAMGIKPHKEKVLGSIRRRLRELPPLDRLEVLGELTAETAREAMGDQA